MSAPDRVSPSAGSTPASAPDASSAGTVIGFGTVSAFDAHRGLGSITDGQGREVPFHCTAIADGSRTIEVGAGVVFRSVPGHLGRMEAVEVQPIAPA